MEQVARKTYWQIFWRWGYWAPIIWTFALFALIFYAVFDHRMHQMNRDAIRTEATVTAKEIEISYGRNGEKRPWYRLSWHYRNLSGQTVAQSDPVDKGFYDSLSVGQVIPFLYDPTNSGHYEIVPAQMEHTAIVNLAVAGALFACGSWIVAVSDLWARRAIRVRDTGELKLATITGRSSAVFHPMTVLAGRQNMLFRSQWRTDDRCLAGTTWAAMASSLPPVGATITIYADPTGKLPAVWTGDCGVR